jgi:hypothetical protein
MYDFLDGAVVGVLFSRLNRERKGNLIYTTRQLAFADRAGNIQSAYNPTRRHSQFGAKSPDTDESRINHRHVARAPCIRRARGRLPTSMVAAYQAKQHGSPR